MYKLATNIRKALDSSGLESRESFLKVWIDHHGACRGTDNDVDNLENWIGGVQDQMKTSHLQSAGRTNNDHQNSSTL